MWDLIYSKKLEDETTKARYIIPYLKNVLQCIFLN